MMFHDFNRVRAFRALTLTLFLIIGVVVAFPAAASANIAIAMSGSFAGNVFVLAPGMSAADVSVIVFNQGSQSFTAKVMAESPEGVSINLSQTSFTLAPKTNKRLSVSVNVGQSVSLGEYQLKVTAQAEPPQSGGISVPVAVAQTATLKVIHPFNDISGHWAEKDILVMADLGIAGGVGGGKFAPNSTLTRAQFTAFILRCLDIQEAAPVAGRFSDVAADAWYAGVAEAAYLNGLVVSREVGVFGPDTDITREEIADLLARALEKGGRASSVTDTEAALAQFTDASQISTWARDGAATAASTGIVGGRPDGSFAPLDNATRAEAMVMLKRMLSVLGKLNY